MYSAVREKRSVQIVIHFISVQPIPSRSSSPHPVPLSRLSLLSQRIDNRVLSTNRFDRRSRRTIQTSNERHISARPPFSSHPFSSSLIASHGRRGRRGEGGQKRGEQERKIPRIFWGLFIFERFSLLLLHRIPSSFALYREWHLLDWITSTVWRER